MGPVGVLALQGDFREHQISLEKAGAATRLVRRPDELKGLSALVIPGGESTTIGRLATLYGLIDPLREVIEGGLPTLGTCAGMILMADGAVADQPPLLGVLDLFVDRNGFGRQNHSFEAPLAIAGLASEFTGVFIRAPRIVKLGSQVEVLATIDDEAVMVRQSKVLASSFHPELTDDIRIHRMLLEMREEA